MSYFPTHNELVLRAETWLKKNGFKVAIRDPFKAATSEFPDVIAWRYGVSVVIECKTSLSDFRQDRRKPFRKDPRKGMGQWRIYFAPKGLIQVESLPDRWGLIEVTPKQAFRTHGVPKGNIWSNPPFDDFNSEAERIVLTSALRRLEIRGHLDEIYDGLPSKEEVSTRWYPISRINPLSLPMNCLIEFIHNTSGHKKFEQLRVSEPFVAPKGEWMATRYCQSP